jgi:hypothetical protein
MDQSTEEVTPAQPAKDRFAPRFHKRRWHGRNVTKAAVRTVPIVVLGIGPQDADKLLAADDEQLVKTLSAYGTDPPFSVCVGVGRPNRCEDDLGTGRAPHIIERPAELGVPVADQELERGA